MVTYVFPGQGSQYKGMGSDLFDNYYDLVKQADEILGYSVEELCLNDHDNRLNSTQYTQPALYVVNALSYFKKVDSSGIIPDFLAGHSLGEYNALLAADVFDFSTGLKLVKKRGELMNQNSDGSMAAILGMTESEVKNTLNNYCLDSLDVANINQKKQIVISGKASDIQRAELVFKSSNAMGFFILNVSGAFHSRYMESAESLFESYLEQFELKTPKIPVISNVTSRPYRVTNMKKNLAKQIVSTVRWSQSMKYLFDLSEKMVIEQVGPGNVLTKMIRNIKRDIDNS